MKRLYISIILSACVIFNTGCVKEKSEFKINPNGSGKVCYEATIQPMSFEVGGGKPDLKAQLNENAKKTLTESSGIDAWMDVSHKLTDDGKIYFKGTAYFPDITKLDIQNGFSGFSVKKNKTGEIVIDLESKDMEPGGDIEHEDTPVELSEDELNKRVQEAKAEYSQTKMMMQGFLSNLKVESILHLPGTIKEFSNVEKIDSRTVRFVLSGAKLLEVMDEMIADESMLRQQIREGKDPTDYSGDDLLMNEKLFGQKAPVRIVIIPDSENLFDYDSEVGIAKKNYKKMISQLGLEAGIVERDDEVLVPKVRSLTVAENYGKERLRLSMSVKLPEKAIGVMGGKIEKAISGSGKNILGGEFWDKDIDAPRQLKNDGQTCDFEVHVLVPDEQEKSLKEIVGYLDYITAKKSRKIDLGMMEFKAGSKSKEQGFSIHGVKVEEWDKESTTMTLSLDLQLGAFKSAEIYDQQGRTIEVSESGEMSSADRLKSIDFRTKGSFPPRGRIVLDVWDDVKKHRVGFKVSDILLGRDEPSVDQATGLLIAKIPYVQFPQIYGEQGNEYKLPLMVKLQRPILSVSDGAIEKVTTAGGENLLPEREWSRRLRFPKLKKDNKSVEFSIGIRNPQKQKELIKEIYGTLEYFTSDGTKKVETGLIGFRQGTEIEEIGAKIESIAPDDNQNGFMTLQLAMEQIPHQAILSAEFYSPNGQKLNVRKSGWGTSGNKSQVIFSVKGNLPTSGRIVLQVAKDLKKNKVGFKAVNILLNGDSFESKGAGVSWVDTGTSRQNTTEAVQGNKSEIDADAVKKRLAQFQELDQELNNIEQQSDTEITEWINGLEDLTPDIVKAVYEQIGAEYEFVRKQAVEEKADKTTTAIDGMILYRSERFDKIVEKIQEEQIRREIMESRRGGRSRRRPRGRTGIRDSGYNNRFNDTRRYQDTTRRSIGRRSSRRDLTDRPTPQKVNIKLPFNDPNEVKARLKTFEGLEKELQNINRKGIREMRGWTARQGTSSPILAEAVYQQVEEELHFARKIAIEEKAAKTTVVIDGLLVTRNERLDKLSETMVEEKRKLRRAEPRTGRTRIRR